MNFRRIAEQIKALGEPTRLQILRLLPNKKSCKDVYNVSELAEELNIPQPTVSHHLKVLYNAGLVENEKMCRDVYYWINKKEVQEMASCVLDIVDNNEQ